MAVVTLREYEYNFPHLCVMCVVRVGSYNDNNNNVLCLVARVHASAKKNKNTFVQKKNAQNEARNLPRERHVRCKLCLQLRKWSRITSSWVEGIKLEFFSGQKSSTYRSILLRVRLLQNFVAGTSVTVVTREICSRLYIPSSFIVIQSR